MTTEQHCDNEKFGPTFRGIFTLILSLFMFGALSYIIWTGVKRTGSVSTTVIVYFMESLMLVFVLLSIYYIFKLKIIRANKGSLVIKYPLLFRKITIPFSSITAIQVNPQILKTSTRTGIITVYEGKRVLIKFDGHKHINIDAFHTRKFDKLCLLLKSRIK